MLAPSCVSVLVTIPMGEIEGLWLGEHLTGSALELKGGFLPRDENEGLIFSFSAHGDL